MLGGKRILLIIAGGICGLQVAGADPTTARARCDHNAGYD